MSKIVSRNDSPEQRVLVLAPFGKDAVHLCHVLGSEGIPCKECKDFPALVEDLKLGAALILTTEEVLLSRKAAPLLQAFEKQPTWSSMPIIAFYSENPGVTPEHNKTRDLLQPLTEVTFMQKPIAKAALLSAVRASLRDRNRQYQIRDLLAELEAHAATAVRATQMKSQFLANMSHEIRTPLGAIMGFLDLIKGGAATKEEVSSYISVVTRNADQLMRLIDDILDISKVEAGRMEFEFVEFSLGELLFDFAALMGFKAREKGVIFDLNLQTSMPAKIKSDPTRLRQVLTNAVGNAIKFTERGSVQLSCAFHNGVLKFTVSDTGRGITPEQADTLFQPFSQADSSTTRKYGGTGLGLVLCQYICREMGGDYVLEKSELGKGSTFVATMNVEYAQDTRMLGKSDLGIADEVQGPADLIQLRGMNVLLVDDSADNRVLFNIMLKKLGASVAIAEDGREAIELASKTSYDVILMDVQMPYMDGHEATRYLRRNGYKKPIIALTAHAMTEERERASDSGFSDFLSKPLHFQTLANTLSSYFVKSN